MSNKKKPEVVDAEVVESKELQLSPDFTRPESPEIEAEISQPEPEPVYVEKKNEYLRYSFTDDEIIDISKKLARGLAEAEAAKRELKEVGTQLKAVVEAKENSVATLAHLVQNGYEYRTIECEIHFNTPQRGFKALIRLDTGEMVSSEKMTGTDLQGQLFRKQEHERREEPVGV